MKNVFYFILYSLLLGCRQPKNYIVVNIDCHPVIRDYSRPCEALHGRQTIVNSGTKEYAELNRLQSLCKDDSIDMKGVDADIWIGNYRHDTLYFSICANNTGYMRMSNQRRSKINDSLVRYLYKEFCK